MTFRKFTTFTLSVLALVVGISFGYGGYLLLVPSFSAGSRSPAPRTAAELLREGNRLLAGKQAEQALLAFRRALSIDPHSIEAQLGVARAERLAGRDDDAGAEYERALRLDPRHPDALKELAVIYSHRSDTWSGAEKLFRRYLDLRQDDADGTLRLARVLAWRGDAAGAAQLFQRPDVAPLMTLEDRKSHAFALIKSGQTSRAEAALNQILTSGHHDSRLTLQLAHLYAARKEWRSALPLYRRLLEDAPLDAPLNLAYGLGLLANRSYAEALGPLRAATRAMPSHGVAGLAYARALKGGGQRAGAVREFERVLPHYRGNGPVVREYADLLLEQKQWGGAAQHYKQALALGVGDARLHVALAGALRGNRKPREALTYLQKAYAIAPTDRLAMDLARLHHQLGQSRQALALLDSISAGASNRALH